MTKHVIFKKPKQLKKQAEEIIITGEIIFTRMAKSVVKKRVKDWRAFGYKEKFGNNDYSQFINWGTEGGRPRIYKNESEKKQAYRLRKKLKSHEKTQQN